MTKTIALDAMGGDHGPPVVVPAGLQVLRNNPDLHIVFVGRKEVLQNLLDREGSDLIGRGVKFMRLRKWLWMSRLHLHYAIKKIHPCELPLIWSKNRSTSLYQRREYRCVNGHSTIRTKNTSRY